MTRLALLGLGLIGGSIARAVRSRDGDDGRWSIIAWSPTGRGPAEALAADVIDEVAPGIDGAADGADLIVVAAPPLQSIQLIGDLGRHRAALATDAVVTDIASTKQAIVRAAEAATIPFVGGHPMAGSERTGFAAASADLFVGRPWVVTPTPDAAEAAIARVEDLARRCGADPIRMDPVEHDRLVAAISHLPLVIAAALVEAVTGAADWPAARRLAASGWRDTTRLARGDSEMAAGIAATNAVDLAGRLRVMRDVLDGWIVDLEAAGPPDADRLRDRFAAARSALNGDP